MKRKVEAVFENGLLRPLEPLNLAERQAVMITLQVVDDNGEKAWLDHDAVAMAKGSAARAIPLAELRKMTVEDTSNWAEEIIAERGDY